MNRGCSAGNRPFVHRDPSASLLLGSQSAAGTHGPACISPARPFAVSLLSCIYFILLLSAPPVPGREREPEPPHWPTARLRPRPPPSLPGSGRGRVKVEAGGRVATDGFTSGGCTEELAATLNGRREETCRCESDSSCPVATEEDTCCQRTGGRRHFLLLHRSLSAAAVLPSGPVVIYGPVCVCLSSALVHRVTFCGQSSLDSAIALLF